MRTEKKELNIQIGKRLQIARQNSGYTQEAFAEALRHLDFVQKVGSKIDEPQKSN